MLESQENSRDDSSDSASRKRDKSNASKSLNLEFEIELIEKKINESVRLETQQPAVDDGTDEQSDRLAVMEPVSDGNATLRRAEDEDDVLTVQNFGSQRVKMATSTAEIVDQASAAGEVNHDESQLTVAQTHVGP